MKISLIFLAFLESMNFNFLSKFFKIDFSCKFTNYIHTFNISNIAILAIFAITSAKFPIKTPSVAKKSSKMPTFAKAKKEISSSTVAEIDKFCPKTIESQYLGNKRLTFVTLAFFCKCTPKTQFLFVV